MIKKIRGLLEAKELIDEILEKTKEYKDAVFSLKSEIEGLRTALEETKQRQNEFLESFREDLNVIKSSRQELKEEVYNFKLLQDQTRKQILDKFEEEISNNIKDYFEKLKTDADSYEELKEKIVIIARRTSQLSEELDKFNNISRNIKKEDFELTKFANRIFETDKEKLELMKKIDNLERLIAKMRRAR
jgi:chromosome segregation ATPase